MTDEPDTDVVVAETVETLQRFEFTAYEAKCFVALTRIERGTAKEVSEVADVPQARVYDCMDTLRDRGLVDVQEGTPREFRAASPEQATNVLERRYRSQLDRLGELLPRLEAPESRGDDGDVWTVEGGAEVGERAAALLADAHEETLLAVAAEDLLTESVTDALATAAARDVDVRFGSPSAEIREAVAEAAPTAEVVETWTWWTDYPVDAGAVTCVLLVDGDALLVSTDVPETLPGVSEHRAVWTDSGAAPIVGVLRPLLARAILGDRK